MGHVNQEAFRSLLAGDRAWLRNQRRSIERDHIENLLERLWDVSPRDLERIQRVGQGFCTDDRMEPEDQSELAWRLMNQPQNNFPQKKSWSEISADQFRERNGLKPAEDEGAEASPRDELEAAVCRFLDRYPRLSETVEYAVQVKREGGTLQLELRPELVPATDVLGPVDVEGLGYRPPEERMIQPEPGVPNVPPDFIWVSPPSQEPLSEEPDDPPADVLQQHLKLAEEAAGLYEVLIDRAGFLSASQKEILQQLQGLPEILQQVAKPAAPDGGLFQRVLGFSLRELFQSRFMVNAGRLLLAASTAGVALSTLAGLGYLIVLLSRVTS